MREERDGRRRGPRRGRKGVEKVQNDRRGRRREVKSGSWARRPKVRGRRRRWHPGEELGLSSLGRITSSLFRKNVFYFIFRGKRPFISVPRAAYDSATSLFLEDDSATSILLFSLLGHWPAFGTIKKFFINQKFVYSKKKYHFTNSHMIPSIYICP